jgi:Na+-translocating ferredoxin:NAD+ oxidoreductase RnfC subunit
MQHIKDRDSRHQENMRVANLDEDDEKEENSKSEEQRELDNLMIERNQEAAKNVTEIFELKNELKFQGKTTREINNAVNTLKAEQKQRGRPKAEALKNPIKDSLTGMFVENTED